MMVRTLVRSTALVAGVALVLAAPAGAAQTYTSPEAAGAALVAAFERNDDQGLRDVLGPGSEDVVSQGADPVVAEARKDIVEAAKKKLVVSGASDGRAVLELGDDAWPFPIPLVREGSAWRFDVAAGREEVRAREIGRNELEAIDVCADYAAAQVAYAAKDRDGDLVREYAQRILSTPGKQDGLYWEDASGNDPSPVAVALGDAAAPVAGAPYGGYRWKILTAQGANAPGGAHSYVINGNMIAGFALVGTPAVYGKSGVMTFVVSNHGTIYEKDLGEQSPEIVKGMETFDPDDTWVVVEPDERGAKT